MKRGWYGLSALILCAFVAAKPAHAWTKVKNNSPNVIFVAHGFASVSSIFCGWDDNCDAGYRVRGWWAIAGGGGSVTVNGNGHGNAIHDIYAEDQFGHVWDGHSNSPGLDYTDIPNTAFDHCEDGITNTSAPNRSLLFARVRASRCCGGACPSNGTININ